MNKLLCSKTMRNSPKNNSWDTNKVEGQTIEVEFGNAYAREIESFSNSLLTGAELEVPAQQAVQVQRIMEAAYRSNDEKVTVTL